MEPVALNATKYVIMTDVTAS